MVDPFENMQEARFDKAQRGLMPARIERHKARVAVEFESALHTIRRQEAQGDCDAQAQSVEPGADRERGLRGLNGVLEQHVELALVPEHIESIRQLRTVHARERLLESRK